jgi:hypothetical protein
VIIEKNQGKFCVIIGKSQGKIKSIIAKSQDKSQLERTYPRRTQPAAHPHSRSAAHPHTARRASRLWCFT